MRRKIPSTASLAAFEAAARHQSFTLAAEELAVTQSAVCRQIASLEDFVGLKLFRRTRRGVALTEAGERYSRRVRARLDAVERDTLELMAQGGEGGALELGVVPTFATRWLLPRLGDFQRQHPSITVHLTPRVRPFLFDDSGLDAALYAGPPGWPGTVSDRLLDEHLVAVASPALLARLAQAEPAIGWTLPLGPEALARLPLLQMSTRPEAWRGWFEARGLKIDHALAGPRMELFSMLSEAACQGLGAALVPRFLMEDELAQGRLLALTPEDTPSDRSVHLIVPLAKAQDPVLATFRDWLLAQARSYAAGRPSS
jgi:DNA-binding transcriptional LysR family regulator